MAEGLRSVIERIVTFPQRATRVAARAKHNVEETFTFLTDSRVGRVGVAVGAEVLLLKSVGAWGLIPILAIMFPNKTKALGEAMIEASKQPFKFFPGGKKPAPAGAGAEAPAAAPVAGKK